MAAGDLDPSFGVNGRATVSFGAAPVTGVDVAVQADGKTVIAARAGFGGTSGFYLTRLNVNGTPDTTFGPDHNGRVFTPLPDSAPYAVAVQPDGRIVVAGVANFYDAAVVRYNSDGTPDPTFDLDGTLVLDTGLRSTFTDLAIQADGKLLLGGSAPSGLALLRLDPDGSKDASFAGGLVAWNLQAEGVLGGLALDYSGTPATNPSFGSVVVAATLLDAAKQKELLLTRIRPDGSLDTVFGSGGSAHAAFPADGTTGASAVLLQGDGKIVVGGQFDPLGDDASRDFVLGRFLPDGTPDLTFGTQQIGWARTDMGGRDTPNDLTETTDGDLILNGATVVSGSARDAFAFYTHDGLADARYGSGGTLLPFTQTLGHVAQGPGRRFVAAGGDGSKITAARFFNVGANLVYVTAPDPVASEGGPTPRDFFVRRLEALPYPTRVYFDVGGTATAPTFRAHGVDYSAGGMTFPIPVLGGTSIPYVDIPADQTVAVVTVTPVDDALPEGDETITLTVRPDPEYDVGDPSGVALTIADNDTPPPAVAEVYVKGSAWRGDDGDPLTTTFGEALAAAGAGDASLGFRVDNVAAGTTLPWINANRLVLRYSSPPAGAPAATGVALHGLRSDYVVTAVDPLDARTFVLTLDRPLGNAPAPATDSNGDRITLTVEGGNADGTPYALALTPLPGDADRVGGRVSALDLGSVKARVNRTANDAPGPGAQYTPFTDVNADGRVNALDLGAVKARLNDNLPALQAAALAAQIGVAPEPLHYEPITAAVCSHRQTCRRKLLTSADRSTIIFGISRN